MEINHQDLCEFISQRRRMADSDSQIVEALLADPNCVTHVLGNQFAQETRRSAGYISAGTLDAILADLNEVLTRTSPSHRPEDAPNIRPASARNSFTSVMWVTRTIDSAYYGVRVIILAIVNGLQPIAPIFTSRETMLRGP